MLYAHDLNMGNGNRLTTSVWDDNVANWMLKTQTYVQSSGGIWIPLALDANGYLKSSVKDSALPAGAATEAKQDTLIGYINMAWEELGKLDLRGLAVNKPLATAVQIGATYWSVDTDPNADAIEVSNGTDWSVMA